MQVQHTRAAHRAPPEHDPVALVMANWVRLAAAALIAAQLWLKAEALGHFYFRQDDFYYLDRALRNRLDWHFLMTFYQGHMMPGGWAYTWVLARISVYDWTLASTVTLAVLAAASVALFRLLRTLFGERPAILIPLSVYLFSPIMLSGLSFWATTLQWLPTQLAIFMALNAHVQYLRTGRLWHAGVAVGWIALAMLFDDIAALIPVLVLTLTLAYLAPEDSRGFRALTRYWRAWMLYGLLVAGYVTLFVSTLPIASIQPHRPGLFSNLLTVASTMLRIGFIPGAVGGLWRWFSVGGYGYAVQVPGMTYAAWGVAIIVVLVSLWVRRRAIYAWLLLAAWAVITGLVPVIVGRLTDGTAFPGPAAITGGDLRYAVDTLPVLAVCIALAFWPLAWETGTDVYRAYPPPQIRRAGALLPIGCLVAGSLWSYHAYEHVVTGAVGRSYIATARAALAAAPQGSVIVDTPVPAVVEIPPGPRLSYGAMSYVIGPLARQVPAQHVSFARSPSGVYSNLLIFDWLGRLRQAVVYGDSFSPPQPRPQPIQAHHRHAAHRHAAVPARACWTAGAVPTQIQMPGSVFYWPWALDLSYTVPTAATLQVAFGGRQHVVALPAGSHDAFVPALGAGSIIGVQVLSGGPTVCIRHAVIGQFVPWLLSQPIPATAVSG